MMTLNSTLQSRPVSATKCLKCASLAKEKERRKRTDAKCRCDILGLVHVHLQEAHVRVCYGQLVEEGSNVSAWPAPLSAEIHHNKPSAGSPKSSWVLAKASNVIHNAKLNGWRCHLVNGSVKSQPSG